MDRDALQKALNVYKRAQADFDKAKNQYENALIILEQLRKKARDEYEIARKEFFRAGEAFTKFTDENPDPDEPNEEDDEDEDK